LDVSIIIVNWNTLALLRDCLNSIYEQVGDVSYEIVVVDNASSDGSPEMVSSDFPSVLLVVEDANRGYAAAINSGIRRAKGRYALILNSDILICDLAIEKTVKYADRHPEAAVIGCQVMKSRDEMQTTCFRFPSLLNLSLRVSGLARVFKYNRFFGRENMLWWQRSSEREVDVVSGMFMLVRYEAIEKVGMMDESYFLFYEDTDWCYRFAQAGWKMLFWPGAKIIHIDGGNKSTDQDDLRMFVQYRKSLLTFFKKNYGLVSYLTARLLLTLSLGLRCCFWTFVAVLKRMLTDNMNYKAEKRRKCWSAFKFCVFGSEP